MSKSGNNVPCMTQKEAEIFVKELAEDIFPNGKVEEVENFYTKDVIGHWENDIFDLSGIKNRITNFKQHTIRCQFKVLQLYVINNFITYSCSQNWIDKANRFHNALVFLVYRMRDRKVCEIWGMNDLPTKGFNFINQNFTKNMLQFELNNKSKYNFLKKLRFAEKAYHNLTLNPTERECLYYYFHGFSAKETASYLQLSNRTVESYIAKIKEKFTCRSKPQLRKKIFPSN